MPYSEQQHRDVFDRLAPEIQRELLDSRRRDSVSVSAELMVEIERAGGHVSEWLFPESPGSKVYVLRPDFVAFLDDVAEEKGYDFPPRPSSDDGG
jgi:hypothetical protein